MHAISACAYSCPEHATCKQELQGHVTAVPFDTASGCRSSKQTLSAHMPPALVTMATSAVAIANTSHAQARQHKMANALQSAAIHSVDLQPLQTAATDAVHAQASQLRMADATRPAGLQPLQTFATDGAPPLGSNSKTSGSSALVPAQKHSPRAEGLSMSITVASKPGTNCNPASESARHRIPVSLSSSCAEAQAARPGAAQPDANATSAAPATSPGLAASSASLIDSATEVAAAAAPPSEVSAALATATGCVQAVPPSESATAAQHAQAATAEASTAGSIQAAPQSPGQAQRYRPDQVVETLDRGVWWPAQVTAFLTSSRQPPIMH